MAYIAHSNRAFGHNDHHNTTRDTNPSITTTRKPTSTSTMTNEDEYLVSKHHLVFPAAADDGLPVFPHGEYSTHPTFRTLADVQPILPPSPGNIHSSNAIARSQCPNKTSTRDELVHTGATGVKLTIPSAHVRKHTATTIYPIDAHVQPRV